MGLERVNYCTRGNPYNAKYLKHRSERWIHTNSMTIGWSKDKELGLIEKKKCLVCGLEFEEMAIDGLIK